MPCADDLEEEVRALGPEGEITDFVTDEESRGLVVVEFFEEGSIGLGSDELIDHVDGTGEEDLEIGVACGVGDAFGQEGFSSAWVTDQYHIPVFGDEVEVEEVEDLGFLVLPGFVVVEIEGVDGDFFIQSGLLETEFDGVLQSMLRFGFSELMEDIEGVVVFLFGLLDDGFQLLRHDSESELDEFFFRSLEFSHDGFLLLIMKASYSAKEGSSRRIRLSFSCWSRTGG